MDNPEYGIMIIVKCERMKMAVSYNNLWKTLIDRKMSKTDLRRAVGMSSGTLARLSKDENVGTMTLNKICRTLNCSMTDVIEYVGDAKESPNERTNK